MSAHGHVDSVGTCAAARLALRSRTFDAMIVDVKLPDGGGFDLIEPARVRSPGVVVLVLTGSNDHSVIRRAHELRAHYLLKPCDASQLALVAQTALERKEARERRTRAIIERWTADYGLSPTEVELLELGADGVARDEFSGRRGVRPDTIRKQIQTLLRKTGDETFEGAVNSLLREALAEPF